MSAKLSVNLIISIFSLCTYIAKAQTPFDVLNTTTSPAFVVMGVSNTEISRPTSLKDFTASIQNASNGFTEIPNTYGVEFRLGKDTITAETLKFKWSHASFSLGVHRINIGEENEKTKVGFGINLPFIPPKDANDKKKIESKKGEFSALLIAKEVTLKTVIKDKDDILRSTNYKSNMNDPDSTLNQITFNESEMRNAIFQLQYSSSRLKDINKAIRDESGKTKVRRFGGFLNLFGGVAWDLPTTFATDSSLTRIGLWLNSGLERGIGGAGNKADLKKAGLISLLGGVKLFHEPHMVYYNEMGKVAYQKSNAVEAGVKGAITLFDDALDISGEFIYRNRWEDEKTLLRNTRKWLINARYSFPGDFRISMTFGKDFENNVQKDGNLISLFNLIKGI